MEENEHTIIHKSEPGPHGQMNKYTCEHDDCYILASGEHRVAEKIADLAEKYSCPANNICLKCDRKIEPDTDICQKCHRQLSVSWRTY
jgi:ribosomal protein L40E